MLGTHPTAKEISTVIANGGKIVPGELERWEQSPPDTSHTACAQAVLLRAMLTALLWSQEYSCFASSCEDKFSSARSVPGH